MRFGFIHLIAEMPTYSLAQKALPIESTSNCFALSHRRN